MKIVSKRASVTVEAALAFPIFFYALMAFCCLFTYAEVKISVRQCMLEAARQISPYGDLVEKIGRTGKSDDILDTLLLETAGKCSVKALVTLRLSEKPLVENCVVGGIEGISFADSVLFSDEESIEIVCDYKLKTPVSIFKIGAVPVRQKIIYRYFTGYKVESLLEEEESDESDEDTVYMTETGTVYHTKLTCPSLKLSISGVDSSQVVSKRNQNGGKYYPCEKCARGNKPAILYITSDGDRYHYKLNCSGLKRTIREVKLKDIPDIRACKRCGNRE